MKLPPLGADLDRLCYDQKTQRAHGAQRAALPDANLGPKRGLDCDGQLQILLLWTKMEHFILVAPASRCYYLHRLLDFMQVLHNWLQQQNKKHFLHQRTIAWGANNSCCVVWED